MDPPEFAREILEDVTKDERLHAYIRPVSRSALLLLALMESAALAPQHFRDLQGVYAVSRVCKSRSYLLCHHASMTLAIDGQENIDLNKRSRLSLACLNRVRRYSLSQSFTPRAIVLLQLGFLQV